MAVEIPTYTPTVIDDDRHFIVDPDTKELSPAKSDVRLAQHSKNSERLTFEIPSVTVEGHEMAKCNKVEIHFRNQDAKTGEESIGIYEVKGEDFLVSEFGELTVSWLVDDDATAYAGILVFSLHYICTEEDKVIYDFPTITYTGLSVGETTWNIESIPKKYPNVIANLEARVTALEKGGIPDGSGGIEIQGPAEVGQTIKVSAVDESGKPTEWEAVDFPISGEWKLFRNITIPTDITTDTSDVSWLAMENGGVRFAFDTDNDGNPFEFSEIFVMLDAVATAQANPTFANIGNPMPDQAVFHASYNYSLYNFISTNKKKAWTRLDRYGSKGMWTAGGNQGHWSVNVSASRELVNIAWGESPVTALSLGFQDAVNGYLAGSIFEFYGR